MIIKAVYVIVYCIAMSLAIRGHIVQRDQDEIITFIASYIWGVLAGVRLAGLI